MRVWLVEVGEPLPIDGKNERLMRVGILANLLEKHGHEIVWWSSTFHHAAKKQRAMQDISYMLSPQYKINLMHATVSYNNNVSISRLINHYSLGKKFARLAELEAVPDIILCALPTLELSFAAIAYGQKKGVPVVLDVRDLWPDIFLELVDERLQFLARPILRPFFRMVHESCAGATAITGITRSFVDWGISCADRDSTKMDREFPLAYPKNTPDQDAIEKAENGWLSFGIKEKMDSKVVCFFGSMGRQFDLETVIEAARMLEKEACPIRFVLCGSGNSLAKYQELAKDCASIVLPGRVGFADIWTLMRMSYLAIAPYLSTDSFRMSVPNKAIEYMSAGLPIVSSLSGVLEELLRSSRCGITYANGDSISLKNCLLHLCENAEEVEIMSKNALQVFEEKYVAETVYGEMIEHLESIAQTSSAILEAKPIRVS